jgi:hypothetical protein
MRAKTFRSLSLFGTVVWWKVDKRASSAAAAVISIKVLRLFFPPPPPSNGDHEEDLIKICSSLVNVCELSLLCWNEYIRGSCGLRKSERECVWVIASGLLWTLNGIWAQIRSIFTNTRDYFIISRRSEKRCEYYVKHNINFQRKIIQISSLTFLSVVSSLSLSLSLSHVKNPKW